MKKLLTLITILGFFSLSITCKAQVQLKLGHVNISEIMDQLPERDSAEVILDRETKEIQATYKEMTDVYNKMFDDYQKGLSTYSDLVKQTKETELLDKQKRLQEFEQNATTTLQNRNAELIKPIYEKIVKAIDKVAIENSFTYILDISKGSVVFTSKDSQNINPLVLKILNPLAIK
jgi:outer membrane protein